MNEFREVLSSLDLLSGLSDEELDLVYAKMEQESHPSGSTVFEEGAPSRALFVVWTGSVEIAKRSPDGTAQRLAVLDLGVSLGEMGLVRDTVRSATAFALTDVVLLVLRREALDSLADEHPATWGRIMRNIAAILAARLESMDGQATRAWNAGKERPAAGRGFLGRLLGG